ncbi:MAG: hypothetical protein DRH03_08835, partial [Deltaproteobacteria bacterium]
MLSRLWHILVIPLTDVPAEKQQQGGTVGILALLVSYGQRHEFDHDRLVFFKSGQNPEKQPSGDNRSGA